MMKIAVDLHQSNLKDGLYTDMGSEGRWATNWAKLLGNIGHQVNCICSGNEFKQENIPNVSINNKVTEDKYDIALLPGPSIPDGLKADLYMFMHFSPLTIEHKDRNLYESDRSVIVYPVEIQFLTTNHPNPYAHKTYFMPTPISERMYEPNFDRVPSIAWTNRWGPDLSKCNKFNAFIWFAKTYGLHTIIFSYQNFFTHVKENEAEEGVRKIRDSLSSIWSLERIPSCPNNQLVEKLKLCKFALNTHGGGLGGSMYEQVLYGAFPLVCTGTAQIFPHIDKRLYRNPYPDTIDEIVENWELPLIDESFYRSALSEYQKDAKPHLYSESLKRFYDIISNYGFKL